MIVGTEDDEKREERLQRLSALVGALSVPPPSHGRTRAYAMRSADLHVAEGRF